MISEYTLTPPTSDDAKCIRDVCLAAGYTPENLNEITGLLVPPPGDRLPPGLAESLARQATALTLLARLFFLGQPVDSESVQEALPGGFVQACLRCGLLVEDQTTIRPAALVVPVDGHLFASDLQRIEFQEDEEFVPTLCDAALHLNAITLRNRVGRTLDLCSGFAMHGILASAYSESVIASDLNPRAEGFARFNAALNGHDNLRAVTGDLFAALAGQRFDLILANPPFIISPDAVTTFRYSPFELDGFVQKMLAQACEYLEEGGTLQTICEWVEIEGLDWQSRLQAWFVGNGCDVWVMPANRQLPGSYARSVLRQTIDDESELSSLQSQWERYFRNQKVAAIQGGFVMMRRRSGNNWIDFTQLTKPIREPIGTAIEQGFAARNLAFRPDSDDAMLDCRPVVANGLRQVETSKWKDFRWQCDSIVLHLDHGLPVTIGIDEYVRLLIEKFDGDRTVRTVLEMFAKEVGLPIEAGRTQGIKILRSMIKSGVLLVAR